MPLHTVDRKRRAVVAPATYASELTAGDLPRHRMPEHSEMTYDGNGGLPAIAYTLKDPAHAGCSLYDLSDRVRMRGWQIASYPLPANRQQTVVQRVLIRHGVSYHH